MVPDACDLSKEAKDSPACVSDGVGFFVDGTKGNDTASGTQAAPFRTIQKAVGAIGNKTRVFVCGGTYPESVRLPSRAKLYGGFTCDSWVYDASIRVDVAPAAVGPALLVKNASDVTITDVFFRAQPGTALAKGSVAGLIQSSQGVHFVRGELVAGAGTKGNDGVLTPATFPVQVNGQNGQLDVLPPPPAKGLTHTCPDGSTTSGGNGGNGFGTKATAGGPAGVGGPAGGKSGAVGVSGAAGAAGVSVVAGTGGLATKDGGIGKSGSPGGGGGGGTGSVSGSGDTYYGGGAGGTGGCGGAGGGGGETGGYSIALASIDSLVTLDNTSCEATTAGAGGSGAPGQPGQVGALGGHNPISHTDDGGSGATGGAGGVGGGGAGGASAAIAWFMGSAPIRTGVSKLTFAPTPAKGGMGGTPGPDGPSVDVLAIP